MSANLVQYPDRDAWLAARRNGIGASEAAVVLGVSHWSTPLQLWAGKRGLLDDVAETPEMRRGKRLEPLVAEDVAIATGLEVVDHGRFTIAWSAETPYLYATLDREIRHPQLGPGVLEIKTVRHQFGPQWIPAELSGLDTVARYGEVPTDAYCQVQHQFLVTGATWGVLAVWIGLDDFRYYRIEPDPEILTRLRTAAAAFWEAVTTGTEPDASEAGDVKVVKRLHTPVEDTLATLPPEAATWDVEYAEGLAQKKAGEERQEAAKAKLLQALGTARRGLVSNGAVYTASHYPVAEKVIRAHNETRLTRRPPKGG